MTEVDTATTEIDSDGLTAGELAYLNSGGEDASGLLSESGTPAPAAPEAPKEAAPDPKPEVKPAPVEAKQDEVKEVKSPAAVQDDDDAPDAQGTISYHKYQRQTKKLREQIAALEKTKADELAAINEKFARGDERLRLLTEALQPAQQEEAAQEDLEPDPNEDILAWANWSRREMGRLREAQSQTHGVVQESAADQRLRENYQRDAASFLRDRPDFGQAYNHLLTLRAATLEAQGYPEEQIRQILHNEEKGLVQRAVQAGKRPASMIYDMAQRMGYRPPGLEPTPENVKSQMAADGVNAVPPPQQPNGNGAAPAPQPSVVEEIERIQKGQAAGKSLSDTGGAANELTVEALAGMSDREFEALYESKRGQIDALLGKRRH